ncbi:sodium:proton antiporter [Mesobacillus campisalis]|uniref:Sodium:proton antiporter n=1 Tax=Mesobacillus campisalis TaxID=1408103 RepID=A0A0M2SY22_9BACI|nr:cation:proton antiporter [Mesobacillus campisalis]KKK37515.1 sodium:proton antiporter [Mesobacillus campisalis]
MVILQIVLILLATKIAGQLSIKLGQPSVLGKIIVGIILGPALLGWVHDSEIITVFSQIGVLLLMFLAGLETDLNDLNENKKAAVLVAVGGVIAPILLSYFAAQIFGFNTAESIFVGLLLSATSVSISVQTLRELGWLNSKEGSALLGAAVLDDIIVVILLAIAISFFANSDTNLALLIGKKILFFVVIILAAKWVVPRFIQVFSKFKVTETVLSAGLIICFSFAYFAEYLGVAGIIGTFFAGIAISQTKYKEEIEHKVEPIANGLFVPFFFVSIGLAVSFNGIGSQLGFLTVFSIIAVLSKFIGSGIGARVSGFNNRSSMGIGAGMISRGEVALIIAAMGLDSGLLPIEYYTSMIIVVILTTLVTPPLLKVFFGTRTLQVKINKTDVSA